LEDASASAVFSQLVNPQGRWWGFFWLSWLVSCLQSWAFTCC
jgi:hypothetical protein